MKCPSSFRFIFLITYTPDEESLDTLYPPFSPFQVTYLSICPPRSRASGTPTPVPTSDPTARPTTSRPSNPTQEPTISLNPTMSPTLYPTLSPTISQNPTLEPTDKPTINPTLYPTRSPTLIFGLKEVASDGGKNMKFDLLGLLLLALPVSAAAYLF